MKILKKCYTSPRKWKTLDLDFAKNLNQFLVNLPSLYNLKSLDVREFFRKTNISYTLICTRTCAYQRVRKCCCFFENFAYSLNEWFPISLLLGLVGSFAFKNLETKLFVALQNILLVCSRLSVKSQMLLSNFYTICRMRP